MKRYLAGALVVAAATLTLTACGSYGESHTHNAPAPAYDIHAQWVRVQSPGNYATIIRACVGKDGIYENTDGQNSVTVVPNDPDCNGTEYGIPSS